MANLKTQKKRAKKQLHAKRIGVCFVSHQGTVVAVAGVTGPLATSWQRSLTRSGGSLVAWPSAAVPSFALVFKTEAQAAAVFNEAFQRPVMVSPAGPTGPEAVETAETLNALLGAVL